MKIPATGSKWRNKKTQGIYKVLGVGVHTENQEQLVVYQAEADIFSLLGGESAVWIRPLSMWEEKFEEVKDD